MNKLTPIAIDETKPEDKRPLQSWSLGEQRRSDVMHSWNQCPACGEYEVDITNFEDLSDTIDTAIYLASCQCGWKGELFFNLEYQDTVTDPNGFYC